MKYKVPFGPRVPGVLYLHFGKVTDVPVIGFPDTPEMRKHHYPEKRGDRAWKVVNGLGEVIDQYTPRK